MDIEQRLIQSTIKLSDLEYRFRPIFNYINGIQVKNKEGVASDGFFTIGEIAKSDLFPLSLILEYVEYGIQNSFVREKKPAYYILKNYKNAEHESELSTSSATRAYIPVQVLGNALKEVTTRVDNCLTNLIASAQKKLYGMLSECPSYFPNIDSQVLHDFHEPGSLSVPVTFGYNKFLSNNANTSKIAHTINHMSISI